MTKYNDKIKRDFIELVKSNKHSLASAVKKLGVNESAGKRWWKMYSIYGVKGLDSYTK
jgi:transposase-like protein